MRAGGGDVEQKIAQLVERNRELEKEVQELKGRLAGQSGRDIADAAVDVGDAKVVAELIEGADMETLRTACDRLKDRFERAAIVLATVEDGKVRLVAGVTKNLTDSVQAGKLVNHVAQQVGGKGRRQAGHGAGRWQRPGRARRRARLGRALGRAAGGLSPHWHRR